MQAQINELFTKYNIPISSETPDEINIYCPFHKNVNSAAFFINKRTGLWQCFNPSCGKKGNFKQLYRHVTGKVFGKDPNLDHVSLRNEIESGFRKDVCEEELSIDNLAIDYSNTEQVSLLQKFIDRGLSLETMEYFEIGYSKIKNRIVIPVRNAQYKIIGLIGRATTEDQQPRYLYNKGFKRADTLFNIQNAKYHNECIVVEGSVDAMMVHQAGYPYVVATLGAQVSSNQSTMLKKYFDTITILSDNDEAGDAMSGIIEESCLGKNIFKARIPEGLKDPGEMTKEQIKSTVENRESII